MKHIARIVIVVVLWGGLCTVPAVAVPCDKTFDPDMGTTGDWGVDDNWAPPGEPDDTHRACIPAGLTCNVQVTFPAAEADSIEVTGTLVIKDGAMLTIDTDSNVPGTLEINGTLKITGDLVVTGAGEIDMVPDGGTPTINGGATMTLTIESLLLLKGAGNIKTSVENLGNVYADAGTLEIGVPLVFANVSGNGSWRAQNAGKLIIDPGSIGSITGKADWTVAADSTANEISLRGTATNLAGPVTVLSGGFGVEDFCTTGQLHLVGAAGLFQFSTLTVANGAVAKFSADSCP